MQWFTQFHALKRNHSATTQSACPSNQLRHQGWADPNSIIIIIIIIRHPR